MARISSASVDLEAAWLRRSRKLKSDSRFAGPCAGSLPPVRASTPSLSVNARTPTFTPPTRGSAYRRDINSRTLERPALQHCSQISRDGWQSAGRRRVTWPHSSSIDIAPRPHGVRAVTARLRRSRGRSSASCSMIISIPPAFRKKRLAINIVASFPECTKALSRRIRANCEKARVPRRHLDRSKPIVEGKGPE